MPRDDVTEIQLIDDCTARLERIFRCTPEVLWDVMTDPARIPEWWGPAHHSPTVIEMDVRTAQGAGEVSAALSVSVVDAFIDPS